MLAYGVSADSLEYLRIGESTALECLNHFCSTVVEIFGAEYIWPPTAAETAKILKHSASREFPRMLGSIDCTHWVWKKCPMGWAGQYQDRKGTKSVILEAVCTYDLRIWHLFFGCLGSLNDINVLDKSHLFYDKLKGRSPSVTFNVNDHVFNQPDYLADRIYPPWAVFVQMLLNSIDPKGNILQNGKKMLRRILSVCSEFSRPVGQSCSILHLLFNPA